MIWSLLEAQNNVCAGFHTLPSSQEQVAAFKRQEAANVPLLQCPPQTQQQSPQRKIKLLLLCQDGEPIGSTSTNE